jgi:hypothetical protein
MPDIFNRMSAPPVDPDLRLPLEEVRRLLEAELQAGPRAGKTVDVVDARGRSSYARSSRRVEGDVRVLGSRDVPRILPRLSPDRPVLVYCG